MFGWIAIALGGWLWGSFLNQCVDRLGIPEGSWPPPPGQRAEPRDPASAPDPEQGHPGVQPLSLLRPARSLCLACGVPIPWYDNIPVVSYLVLGGRCRRCGTAIGRRTLVLEIITPLIGLGVFAIWGWTVASVGTWLAASWTLVAVPMRLEGRAWSLGWTWLGVALWTFFFWAATLGWLMRL